MIECIKLYKILIIVDQKIEFNDKNETADVMDPLLKNNIDICPCCGLPTNNK